MSPTDKPLVWLRSELKSPPLSASARREAGALLRLLQRGERLGMPASRPMPIIGPRCHELRIVDGAIAWRIVYRLDPDAVVLVAIFAKKSAQTPHNIITTCQQRLKRYDATAEE